MSAQHTPLPWVYMSKEFDDWGFIRDADDNLVAVAKWPALSAADLNLIRTAGDDPARDTAAFIIRACNSFDALVKALKMARVIVDREACDEVDVQQIDAALALAGEMTNG